MPQCRYYQDQRGPYALRVKWLGRYWLPVLPLVLVLVHHNRTFAVQKPAERKAVFAMLCLTSFVILQGAGLYATFQMPS